MIRLNNFSLKIKEEPIVNNLTFEIKEGETVALIGNSGCGKSMTALSILRLVNGGSTSGEILFNGTNLLSLSEAEMCQLRGKAISAIFQDPNTALNPTITVGEQVAEALTIHQQITHREALDQATTLLKRLGITRNLALPYQLSGGMRQRVLIAMAIANKPQLLIADEPTTALDPIIQNEILELLQEIQDELNMSILLISHDPTIVKKMSNRILYMENGSLIEKIEEKPHFSTKSPKITNSRAPLLEVRDWNVQFQKIKAVDGISFEINESETVAVVGESGSGKTTLAKSLLGLTPHSKGEISFYGEKIEHLSPAEGQIVFQNPYASLNPKMRIESILREPYQLQGKELIHSTLHNLLDEVQLSYGTKSHYPKELSGGQRQRVAIARALSLSTPLLILDEPFSALDSFTQGELIALLQKIQSERQTSYLFITHDIAAAAQLAHKIVVMNQGKIVEFAPADQLLNDPKHPYTQKLLRVACKRKKNPAK